MTSDTSGDTAGTAAATDEQARRDRLVDVWRTATHDAIALLEDLDDADWDRPTDLPGWDVKAIAAHLAHLESELAGMPQQQVEVPEAAHVRNVMGQYTETGPVARREWPVSQILEELRTAVATRDAGLRDSPPTLGDLGPSFAALAGWTWETLLTNRPLDFWMHEQDVRRAVGRPGGLDSDAAVHVATVYARSLPMVVGKRAQGAPGQSVVLEVTQRPREEIPAHVAVAVGDDGRARPVEPPADPTVRLRLSFEDWMIRAGGRRPTDEIAVEVEGDADLGHRVLDALAVTI